MDKEQIALTNHWLEKFTALSNEFWERDNRPNYEYWKGQVMGICKIVDLIGVKEIDTKYYLNKLT